MNKTFTILAAILLLASCDKPFEMDLPLSVAQRSIKLTKDAGSTHVLVYADGEWTASFAEPVDWASLNKVSGYGNSDLVFSYSANYGITRRVGIVLTKDELRDTVVMTQEGMIASPLYTPEVSEVKLGNFAAKASVSASGNLYYCADAVYAYAIYETADGAETEVLIDGKDDDPSHWITSFEPSYDRFRFDVKANGGETREARLKITIDNPSGLTFTKYVTVVQTDIEPVFSFAKDNGNYDSKAQDVLVEAADNTIWPYYDSITIDTGNSDWISNARITPEGLSFSLSENDGRLRYQDLKVSCTLGGQTAVKRSFYITQTSK